MAPSETASPSEPAQFYRRRMSAAPLFLLENDFAIGRGGLDAVASFEFSGEQFHGERIEQVLLNGRLVRRLRWTSTLPAEFRAWNLSGARSRACARFSKLANVDARVEDVALQVVA